LIFAALVGGSASAEITLTVETNNLQRITQWGIVTYNRPDWGAIWDITAYSNAVDALYSELGATVLRFHIDYNTYDQTWAREDLRDAILAATEKGMDWYGLPWSPPAFMKTIDSVNGRVDDVSNYLAEGYEDDVAAWLVDLLQWLDGQGVPLPLALGFQNEPDWDPPGYPGCLYTTEQIQTTTIELRNALDAAGYGMVPVIPSDNGNADDRYPDSDDMAKGALNQLGLKPGGAFETNTVYRDAAGMLSAHTYDIHSGIYLDNPGYVQEFYDAVKDCGKELWMTEWEPAAVHTTDDWEVITETLVHFNRDMSSMIFNGWIHWHVWSGTPITDGSNDAGECMHRIRPGDYFVYNGVEMGTNPTSIAVRVSANTDKVMLSVYIDGTNGTKIAEQLIPKTTVRDREFQTLEIPLDPISGTHDLTIQFSCDEHWREADFNWFRIAGQGLVEAENYSNKTTVETWSSMLASCYNIENRMFWAHNDGQTVQRRPLYYVFKKLWNSAPAGEPTYVRRMTSSGPAFQGESRDPVPSSCRQDLCALVHSNAMTVSVLNRNESNETVTITGLTGTNAVLYRYTEADAWTVDVDMSEVGAVAISNGVISGLTLPAKSLTILITDSGGDLSSGAGLGFEGDGSGNTDVPSVTESKLIDGGFDATNALSATPVNVDPEGTTTLAASLYNQTTSPGAVTTLDQGWFSGSTSAITLQGTDDPYVQFSPSAGWNKSDRWWFGQMWTDVRLRGLLPVSFDIVDDGYNDGDPSRNVVIEVYSVPDPTAENAKLKLTDSTSSFTLIGSCTVDVTAGVGTYTTEEIDFTTTTPLYAIRIQVTTDGAVPTGMLGMDNIRIEALSEEPVSVSCTGVVGVSGNVLQMSVSTSDPARTFPLFKTNLQDSVWNRVGHSTSGEEPFIVTNLDYSVGSGSNRLIYLALQEAQGFFAVSSN
jgi:O-glycosyl hydrolase